MAELNQSDVVDSAMDVQQSSIADVESDGEARQPLANTNEPIDQPTDTTEQNDNEQNDTAVNPLNDSIDDTDLLDKMKTDVKNIMYNSTIDENFTFKTIKEILKQTYKKKQIKQYNDRIKQYVSELVNEIQSQNDMNVDRMPSIGDDEVDDNNDNDYMDNNDSDDDWRSSKKKSKKIPRKNKKQSTESTSARKTGRKTGPRNPRTALAFFKEEMRQHTSNAEEISEQWMNMTEEEQAQYREKAEQDKLRYRNEMDQLKQTDPELYQEINSRRKIKVDDTDVPTELNQAIQAVKSSRRAQFEEDDAAVDEVIKNLVERMEKAYNDDVTAYNNNKPAVAKLQLLPVVENLCSNTQIWRQLRSDGKILRCFRDWLAYDKHQLPNIKLRTTLYELCNRCEVNSDDLESSTGADDSNRSVRGVALSERLMNLYFHPQETQSNKKLLRQILERWIRIVVSGGGDTGDIPMTYKQLQQAEARKSDAIRARRTELVEQRGQLLPAAVKAKFPERAAFDYVNRPESKVHAVDKTDDRDRMEDREEFNDRRTQMNKKLAQRKKSANVSKASYKVDMAGRRTG